MTQKPVLKIMKPGKSFDSTDLRDYIFHSDHTCLKIHTVSSGQISINSGGTTGYVDISHNLGYVPLVAVYQDGELFPADIVTYADSSKIRITRTLSSPYNQSIVDYLGGGGAVFQDSLPSYYIIAGNRGGTGDGSAIRFSNIYIAQGQTVTGADFEWRNVTTTSGSDIKFKIYGIDQDNTSSFSDYGNANGRPKTTAVRTKTQSPITSEFNFGDDWKDLVQEIVNRPGWSSGNAMGFVFNDNGSATDKVMAIQISDFTQNDIVLKITLTGTGYLTSNYKIVIFKDKIA